MTDTDLIKNPDVLLLRDLAKVLRCSIPTIRNRMRMGVFPIRPFSGPNIPGIDKVYRWRKADVDRFLRGAY
jgi:hypothetical protein